jgi:ComF family protein
MLDKALSFIAPHYCCSCDRIGSLLCENCKNYIKDETKIVCLACHRPTFDMWLCKDCKKSYEKGWAVGDREGVLKRLIGLYKFQRAKEAYKILGNLLIDCLPDLPPDTAIVPIPTVPSHVRERGYDHMMLIAKYIANKKSLKLLPILRRKTYTKQRQAGADLRKKQAKLAFGVEGKINSDIPYLILDDVVTTGSTIEYAAKTLKRAGAKRVWAAVVAKQPFK